MGQPPSPLFYDDQRTYAISMMRWRASAQQMTAR